MDSNPYLNEVLAKKALRNIKEISSLEHDILKRYLNKTGKVLELGFGNAGVLMTLFKDGFRYLAGIEISPLLVKHARVLFPEGEVIILEGDFLTKAGIPEQKSIIAFHFFTTIINNDTRKKSIKKAGDILENGGYLITKTFKGIEDQVIKTVQEGIEVEIFIPDNEKWKKLFDESGFDMVNEYESEESGNFIIYNVFRKR